MRESERWCVQHERAETTNALTCQIILLRDDAAGKGKEGRLRAPVQLQTDRQTGGLSVREGERDIVQSNAPRRSTYSLTCQINLLRDDAAGRARGNDGGGGGWSVGTRRDGPFAPSRRSATTVPAGNQG